MRRNASNAGEEVGSTGGAFLARDFFGDKVANSDIARAGLRKVSRRRRRRRLDQSLPFSLATRSIATEAQ